MGLEYFVSPSMGDVCGKTLCRVIIDYLILKNLPNNRASKQTIVKKFLLFLSVIDFSIIFWVFRFVSRGRKSHYRYSLTTAVCVISSRWSCCPEWFRRKNINNNKNKHCAPRPPLPDCLTARDHWTLWLQ